MKTRQDPAACFKLFRTFTARMTTLVLATVIAFSAALGLSVYPLVAGWQSDAALESLSALATAREYAIKAQISRYMDVGNAFVAPDLGYEVEQLLAAEGVETDILREALLQSMRRKLRSNTLLQSAQVVDLRNRVIPQTDSESEPYLGVGSLLFRQAVVNPALSPPNTVKAAPTLRLRCRSRTAEGTASPCSSFGNPRRVSSASRQTTPASGRPSSMRPR